MDREMIIATDVAEAAVQAFLEQGPRTVVLSGGTTPRDFYARLATLRYPWPDVEVFFADERCVPPDHPDSNAGMARAALLSKVAARAHEMDGLRCDADGYQRLLERRFGTTPRFDFVVLGLGKDGHTASLFPGRPEVEETERWVIGVPRPGLAPFVPRITLTLPVLSAASVALFLVTGPAKREPLQRLMAGEDIPAARVAAPRVLVLADRAAG